MTETRGNGPVAIIGGGITGLSAAYYLSRAGVPNVLLERQSRLGGVIHTEYIDGCVLEAGPEAYLTAKPWAFELIQELGLADEVIGSNDRMRATWIWKGGRFVRMPEGMTLMVPARVAPILHTPLLGLGSKLRMGLEYFRRPPKAQQDRSVAEFIEDHYGREVLDYLAEPLLSGVYGGDPGELSAAAVLPKMYEWEGQYGSLSRGARRQKSFSGAPVFSTMRRGLGQLIDGILEKLNTRILHQPVDRIEKGYRIRAGGDWLEASQVIVACNPEQVLPSLFPQFVYNPATVVGLIYRSEDVPHPMNGFGFLVPRKERRDLAACTWVNRKYGHRAGPGVTVLRCFMTGPAEAYAAELREKMGITAAPLVERVHHWPESMPQYRVGHQANVKLIEDMLEDFPGLHLAGNAYHGVGIPDCVRSAKAAATRAIQIWRGTAG